MLLQLKSITMAWFYAYIKHAFQKHIYLTIITGSAGKRSSCEQIIYCSQTRAQSGKEEKEKRAGCIDAATGELLYQTAAIRFFLSVEYLPTRSFTSSMITTWQTNN
jgi:hypothetical protein